jgi:hypothetical protein
MSQVLGTFALPDFTILAWQAFRNSQTVYYFNFPIFFWGGGGQW